MRSGDPLPERERFVTVTSPIFDVAPMKYFLDFERHENVHWLRIPLSVSPA